MRERIVLLGAALFLMGGFSSAQVLELEGRYWSPTLTSTIKVTGNLTQVPNGIDEIDLKTDLGLKDKSLREWRLSLATGPNSRLRVAYVTMDYSADQNVQRTVVFNGQTYTYGTRVVTDLSLKYWRYGWVWQFVGGPLSTVKFGTLLEAKSVSVDAALQAPNLTPPVTEKKKLSGTLPTLGLVLDIDPNPRFNIFAEASGISAGKHGYFIDGEAGIRVIPLPGFSLVGGYRYFDIEARDDPDFAKIKNAGPFVGASLRF